ncbi:MAG: hypothetical protein ABI591_33710 [Kofleriaceae bacterium]
MIDLGPAEASVLHTLEAAIVAAGMAPLDDATEAALAGSGAGNDAIELAAAMADAQQKFGALDCKATIAAAKIALPLLAQRQAAAIAVPELPRAWAYILLCADRRGEVDLAMRAAARLRIVGVAADLVPAELIAKYPEVDAALGVDPVEVDVETEVPGATVWLDFAPLGPAPQHLTLAPGEHIIAAASGGRRGFLVGRPIVKQPKLLVEMTDQSGPLNVIAATVASWHGEVPSAEALTGVLAKVHTRAALVRHGDAVEVWGHAGAHEPLRRLGGDDGTRTIEDANRAAALLADRVEGWNSHAPDPDVPLLTESLQERVASSHKPGSEPTAWWVYGTIGAALLAGVIVVYAHQSTGDTQEIKLHYP